ncbi:MAG: hypothetical protein ACF8QF_04435 [Phycisphaerales bacterium]
MPRMVLLKHSLPDGPWHYDWLLARDGDNTGAGAGPLISFRVDVDLRQRSLAAFTAQRRADHRSEYLTYEGEISGGRGRVERIDAGVCRIDEESRSQIAGAIRWDGPMRRFEAIKSGRVWQVRLGATDIA